MKLSQNPRMVNYNPRSKKGENAMKKNLLILLVVILMASLTIAAGRNGVKISGTIEAIIGDDTLIVNSITVQTKPGTTFWEKSTTGCVPITFEDLAVGDRVNVVGQYDGDILVANKIIVH